GDMVLTSKLIDGTFPDYNRVIPQNNDKQLKIDRATLNSAVDRVATISSDRGRAVKLSLTTGKIVLTVNNPDSGVAVAEIECDYDAHEIEIGFNSRYLNDILSEIDCETVTVNLADPGSPTLIRGTDESSLYVLMPMRV